MEVKVGTSGYSYKPWRGRFYPEKLPEAEMLGFYAQHFPTVEINNTFYRMPAAAVLTRWSAETPEAFTFVLKSPQRITHHKRLLGVDDDVRHFFETCSVLGAKQGPVLFQLPPHLKQDLARLASFLLMLPPNTRAVLEFRHESWLTEETYDVLRRHRAALCVADVDEGEGLPATLVPTASFGYLRLRRAHYDPLSLADWLARVRGQPWEQAFVFFKHEDEARGPAYAEELCALL